MSMDFDEFLRAVVAVATLEPARYPTESFSKALSRVILKLLTDGPYNFL